MESVARRLLPSLKAGAVLTDVGSVKSEIISSLQKIVRTKTRVSFVGAHPIAGSEKTGVENARADLFRGATCVVTTDGASSTARSVVSRLWKDAGAHVVTIRASEHDRVLALTSHLPHLLSFALFSLVRSSSKKWPRVKTLAAGSFRDMTRVAGSDADVWTGIIGLNRHELKQSAAAVSKILNQLVRQPSARLFKTLSDLSAAKQRW
jgi:prephenate dehydrogenase